MPGAKRFKYAKPKATDATAEAIAPSQVFPGLMEGASFLRPKRLPTKYAAVSATQTSTSTPSTACAGSVIIARAAGTSTTNPAAALGISDYGLRVGGPADLVVFDAPTVVDAIRLVAPRYLVREIFSTKREQLTKEAAALIKAKLANECLHSSGGLRRLGLKHEVRTLKVNDSDTWQGQGNQL